MKKKDIFVFVDRKDWPWDILISGQIHGVFGEMVRYDCVGLI